MEYFCSINPQSEKSGEGEAAEGATTESQLPTEQKHHTGENQSGLIHVPGPGCAKEAKTLPKD